MVKKSISFLVLLILFSAMVTACSKNNGGVPNAEKGNLNNDVPAELNFFSSNGIPEDSFNQQFGDLVRKKFPNYTIKYIPSRKDYGIKELITSGEHIDIEFEPSGLFLNSVMDNNLQYDMSDLIKKHNLDLTRVEPTTVDAMKKMSDGAMYGVPIFNSSMILYYNKDIFDKFGVSYPKDGMSWDDATELAKKVTRREGEKQYVGLSTSPTHLFRLNQFSLPLVDAKTSKATITNNENWKKFYETVFIAPAKDPGYIQYMRDHKNAMPYRNEFLKDKDLAMFAWVTDYMFFFPDDFASMNWDMVSLPTFKEMPGIGTQAYPTYFSITSMSKYKDQGMEVIKYLLSDEIQTHLSRLGVMPIVNDDAVKKAYGQESKITNKNFKAVFYNKFAPISPKTKYDILVESPYVHSAEDIILGKADMNTAFRSIEEKANKLIQDKGSK